MLRVFFWIFFLPLFAVIVLIAVMNPELVEVSLWPALEEKVLFPLYGVALVGLFVGFILGACVAIVQGGRSRQRVRELTRRVENDWREMAMLRKQVEKLEAEQSAARRGQAALPGPKASAA